jgi:protein-disulfide isomerase
MTLSDRWNEGQNMTMNEAKGGEHKAVGKADGFLLFLLACSLIANVIQAVRSRRVQPINAAQGHAPRQHEAVAPSGMAELSHGTAPSRGETSAPVTIVLFADFECPYCRQFAATLNQISSSSKEKSRLIFRQFPLEIHPYARSEAELAACAEQQSNQAFWVLYDYFFQADPKADPRPAAFQLVNSRSDINMAKLRVCVDRHESSNEIDGDIQLGKKYGVLGTPTIFVNGTRLVGNEKDANGLSLLIADKANEPPPLSR